MTNGITSTSGRQALQESIKEEIGTGTLLPGQKLLSTHKLANRYGIAVQTAQNALQELVVEGLLVRQQGKGTFVAEKLPCLQQGEVGLLMSCRGHVWGDFTAAMVQGAQEYGINTILIDVGLIAINDLTSHPAFRKLIASRPLAIITADMEVAALVSSFSPQTHVIAITGAVSDNFRGDVVCPDFHRGGYVATRHLIKCGHENIGLFFPVRPKSNQRKTQIWEHQQVQNGYHDALRKAGLRDNMFAPPPLRGDGKPSVRRKLQEAGCPSAVFAYYDFRAIDVIEVAEEMGLAVPQDLAIVSAYNTRWAEAFGLTSIDYRYDLIAGQCVSLIRDAMADRHRSGCRRTYRFEPRLAIRSSCGKMT